MHTLVTVVEFWVTLAVIAVLFIRGAHESAASSIHELNESSPSSDDAGHDAVARAGLVDLA